MAITESYNRREGEVSGDAGGWVLRRRPVRRRPPTAPHVYATMPRNEGEVSGDAGGWVLRRRPVRRRPPTAPHVYATMPRNEERGTLALVRKHWRAVFGELVATALLVLLGVSSCVPQLKLNADGTESVQGPPLSSPAVAFGFVVLALIQVFGDISGAHMNPAVTFGSTILGLTHPLLAVVYVLAQCVGSTIGFAGLQALVPRRTMELAPFMGVTQPAYGVSQLMAVGVEAGMTGMLVLTACALWSQPHNNTNPIKFGLVIAGLVCVGGEMTGASLNPARSFGPALLMGKWDNHWVYWLGPLLGAALVTLSHRWVLAPHAYKKPAAAAAAPEELPLNKAGA